MPPHRSPSLQHDPVTFPEDGSADSESPDVDSAAADPSGADSTPAGVSFPAADDSSRHVDDESDRHDEEPPSVEPSPISEDVLVRNYDVERAYRIDLTFRGVDGDVRRRTYRLDPGEFHSEVDTLPAGEYEVTAELDTGRTATARCRIGEAPDRMALVEVGNWNVSVTDGVY